LGVHILGFVNGDLRANGGTLHRPWRPQSYRSPASETKDDKVLFWGIVPYKSEQLSLQSAAVQKDLFCWKSSSLPRLKPH